MTVTPEQWAAVAAELGYSMEYMHEQITKLDARFEDRQIRCEYDRDGDPITMGQWSMLYEAQCYQKVKRSILPTYIWICTIWQGIDYRLDGDDPTLFETAVFWLGEYVDSLPPPLAVVRATTETEALADHDQLLREWGRGFGLLLPLEDQHDT